MSTATSPQNSDPATDLSIRENQGLNLKFFHNIGTSSELSSAVLQSVSIHGAQKKKRQNHKVSELNHSRKRYSATRRENAIRKQKISSFDQVESARSAARNIFYRVQGRNRRSTESESQMDRRDQTSSRRRKSTAMGQSAFGVPLYESSTSYRLQQNHIRAFDSGSDEAVEEDDRIPLIRPWTGTPTGYGAYGTDLPVTNKQDSNRRHSSRSSGSSNHKNTLEKSSPVISSHFDAYNVNYPPSIPASPALEPSQAIRLDDVLARDDFGGPERVSTGNVLDEISENARGVGPRDESPHRSLGYECRRKTSLQEREEICFTRGDYLEQQENQSFRLGHGPRRRRGKWPDLAILSRWSRFEKEGASDERRAKKITEPQLIGGRLRPIHQGWHRAEDDAPYRFTYFNEQFQSTIHSQTISELVQPGGSFRELFVPDPPELSDSSESESEDGNFEDDNLTRPESRLNDDSGASLLNVYRRKPRLKDSLIGMGSFHDSREASDTTSPIDKRLPDPKCSPSPMSKTEKPKRFGERPTWWLDVLSPTDAEMKVLSATFGIHPLTTEDILMQEAREKVELFRNYYFINYRSFEQDTNNEDYLEPVNMYVVVFREGVLSFHFSLTPHPANVRRRIRQLKDYLILSSDWISYAIIDDITDVFAPLIQSIEDEVDNIDDAILKLHSPMSEAKSRKNDEKFTESGDGIFSESGGDMLRRVGDCRKKVMGLYRLLGNKADVIKGFAKRCNENWKIAPRSEIGLYLGDIQDHIVTMTGNLTHYEKILARSHGNYLAQINIRMNERQEQTADVLGKLTVLGTIVLPMNIITGLWGMNVAVPGQEAEGDLTWFWCLTAGLLFFGLSCFMIAKILYHIV